MKYLFINSKGKTDRLHRTIISRNATFGLAVGAVCIIQGTTINYDGQKWIVTRIENTI